MANKLLLTLIVFFMLLVSPAISGGDLPAEILALCQATPHPKTCEKAISKYTKYDARITGNSDFFKLAILLALEEAISDYNGLFGPQPILDDANVKAAWDDCKELYGSTVRRLNKTLNSSIKITSSDAQTWLSAAMTNLGTCRAGFIDFGILPMISNDLSALLSNALSLNHDYVEDERIEDSPPKWISKHHRRLLQVSANSKVDIVVAQDGSGNYKTVNQAVAAAAAKRNRKGRFMIYVKQGTYKENVLIDKDMKNIMFLGDGIGKTIITGSRSVGKGSTTFKSATFAVYGFGFIAKGITFQNTAGASNHQAVALLSKSDQSVFYQCSFDGYQDTLYVHSMRQFYRECDIYGTVDMIFGNAAVVLQNCNIYVKDPPYWTNTITAQGRMDPKQNTGIVIQSCNILAATKLSPNAKTYLGRPWRQYSRTVFMLSNFGNLIHPSGWYPWNGNFALNTLYYGEYKNTGPSASTANRVKWKGYHVITSPAVASQFTPASLISANSWLPATGVPFKAGL